MIAVEVKIKNALDDLKLIKEIFSNQKKYKLFSTVAELLLKTYWSETFDREGARRGHDKWAPLHPLYAAYKARKGKSTKPLILDGHLRGSVDIIRETQMGLEWGSQNPYGHYHQEGQGHLPEREMVFLTTDDVGEIGDLLSRLANNILMTKMKGRA